LCRVTALRFDTHGCFWLWGTPQSIELSEEATHDLSVLKTLCESNCAVVVPRLLLPFIFRRRREELVATESIRQSASWTALVQGGYANEMSQTNDLHQLLINHIQVCHADVTCAQRPGIVGRDVPQ
jgi:hypothetical protein